jgi:hypothetical protein
LEERGEKSEEREERDEKDGADVWVLPPSGSHITKTAAGW